MIFPNFSLVFFLSLSEASKSFSYTCEEGLNWFPGSNLCYLNLTYNENPASNSTKINEHDHVYIISDLEFIPRDMLEYFPAASTVVLDFENLEEFPIGLFKLGNKIKYLKIMESQIVRIEAAAFSNLENLVELDLYGNPIIYMDPKIFVNLKQLKILDLRATDCADSRFVKKFDSELLKNCTVGSPSTLTKQFLTNVMQLSQSQGPSVTTFSAWTLLIVLVIIVAFLGLGKYYKNNKNPVKYSRFEPSENTSLLVGVR